VGAKEEDCEGIVNIGRNIEGVEVAVAIRERPGGELKINFRSKNYVDVSAIANRHSGGGHKRAAGCTIKVMNGILNVLKPPGMTSFDVVAKKNRTHRHA